MELHIFCYINSCNNIYSCISCNLFLFWSWLSEWAVETVSDLFLVCTNSIPSLSGILFCLLQSIVLSSKIPRAFSSSLVIKIWISSCPGIDGGVLPEEWVHWLDDIGHYISIWWEDPQKQQLDIGEMNWNICAWKTLRELCCFFVWVFIFIKCLPLTFYTIPMLRNGMNRPSDTKFDDLAA